MINQTQQTLYRLENLNDELKRITSDYKEKGLVVIGINSNEDINYPDDSFENMKKVVEEKGINFIYLRIKLNYLHF